MKVEENKNIPAFPLIDEIGNYIQEGMTLRDYFANSAMQAMLSNSAFYDHLPNRAPSILSEDSYLIADSMLKQREL